MSHKCCPRVLICSVHSFLYVFYYCLNVLVHPPCLQSLILFLSLLVRLSTKIFIWLIGLFIYMISVWLFFRICNSLLNFSSCPTLTSFIHWAVYLYPLWIRWSLKTYFWILWHLIYFNIFGISYLMHFWKSHATSFSYFFIKICASVEKYYLFCLFLRALDYQFVM